MAASQAIADRVQETTATTGTGTLTLAGAVSGYQAFSSAFVTGTRVRYCIVSSAGWEVGDGIFTSSGTTLTRANIYASSNSGSAVSLTGTSNVFCVMPTTHIADMGTAISYAARAVPQ